MRRREFEGVEDATSQGDGAIRRWMSLSYLGACFPQVPKSPYPASTSPTISLLHNYYADVWLRDMQLGLPMGVVEVWDHGV